MSNSDHDYITDLVKRIQNHDHEACELLYKHLANKVYYYALKIVKNTDDAEDIIQESFIQAFQKIDTLEQPQAFLSWFYRIIHNKCVNFLKKQSRTSSYANEDLETTDIIDEDEAIIPEASLNNVETTTLMQNIINDLPEAQRSCIILYYFNELSVNEIAESLECSVGTVKSRLNYGRKQVKEGVLALERKQDTRLYTFAPLSLLLMRLRDTTQDELLSPESLESIWQAVTSTLGKRLGSGFILTKALSTLTTSKVVAFCALSTIIVAVSIPYVATPSTEPTPIPTVNNSPAPTSIVTESSEMTTTITFTDSNLEQAIRLILNKPEGEITKEDTRNIHQLIIHGKYICLDTPQEYTAFIGSSDVYFIETALLEPGVDTERIPVPDTKLAEAGVYLVADYIQDFSSLLQFPSFISLIITSNPPLSEDTLNLLRSNGIRVDVHLPLS